VEDQILKKLSQIPSQQRLNQLKCPGFGFYVLAVLWKFSESASSLKGLFWTSSFGLLKSIPKNTLKEVFAPCIVEACLASAKHVGVGFHRTPVTVTYLILCSLGSGSAPGCDVMLLWVESSSVTDLKCCCN